ncbi:histamine N-methyltransferase B-like [Discoglossus pictus]
MNSSAKSLISDSKQYAESFSMYFERSTEHQCVQRFIDTKLQDIISRIGIGKSALNVLSLGSGTGEVDLPILSRLQNEYPDLPIKNDVVEPSTEHLLIYKDNVSKAEHLDNIHFNWHGKCTSEYQREIIENKEVKQYDLIHMIQMIYYVNDIPGTIKFYQSCLSPHGKLIIIVLSRHSGWYNFYGEIESQLPNNNLTVNISSAEIIDILDSQGMKYEYYDIESNVDITECFINGNKNGQILLDMLTVTCNFNETAQAHLKEFAIELLQNPKCSVKRDGKTLLNTNFSVIVVDGQ